MKSIIIIAAFLLMPFLTAGVSYSLETCNCCIECTCSNCSCSNGTCSDCESCDCCAEGCCTGDAQGDREKTDCSMNTGREATKAGEVEMKSCCTSDKTETHKH